MSCDTAMKGARFNHNGYRVNDLDKSIKFYTEGFGMKLFSRTEMDTVIVAILGYEDAFDADTPVLERSGNLELVHAKNYNSDLPTEVKQSFVKMMFAVPNVENTMKHLKSQGVKVVKEYDKDDTEGVCCRFLGCEHPSKGVDKGLWAAAKGVAFVQDPDDYLIEIIPMEPTVAFS